ncbi:MAG: carboxypeptidase regulatory-like domain-containing protein [Gemmatimonadales bacterium]|nr:MAG: carboxypeptidase regulatory-like domain-containing protein [Gemmatimonadales bacterium]
MTPNPFRGAGALLGLALLMGTLPAPSAGQDAPPPDILGVVVEARTGEPMPGVMIRLMVDDEDGEVLEIASSDAEGRWEIRLRLDEDPGPLVIEARALGHLTARSNPFRLAPEGETVEVPELRIEPDPVELEALEVRGQRRWWQLRHPRDIVRDRQLEGRGIFIPGAVLQQADRPSAAEAISDLVDGLDVEYTNRGVPALRWARAGDICPMVMVNEWVVDSDEAFDLGSMDPREIAVVEFYESYQDLPEDLRRRLAQELGSDQVLRPLREATTDQERCPVINIWRWSEWNRGMGGAP